MNKIIRAFGIMAILMTGVSFAWAQNARPVVDLRSVEIAVPVPPPGIPGAPATPTSGTPAAAPATPARPNSEPAAPATTTAAPVPTDLLRLHLLDGSIITGRLSVKQITVETEYGNLVVPITEVRRMTPGMDSHPALATQINGWIQQLGSSDFAQREAAQRELGKLGPSIRRELMRFSKDSDAERRKRVETLLEELENNSDEEASPADEWIRQDTVQTNLFTVVGKIQPRQFEVASQYGPLKVALADLQMVKKAGEEVKEELRKQVDVPGMSLVQTEMKSSGMNVNKGDQISVTAEGSITLPPWGNRAQSSPDGASNYGWYLPGQIPVGCLVARVGNDGTIVKVGAKSTFTAERSGPLFFGIAMQQDYVGNNFGGQYKVKIRVRPR